MKVTATKTKYELKICIDGILHLMLPNNVDYIYSYIDVHREYQYVIEFQVAGKKNFIEYEKKKLWKKVLKAINEHYD